MQRVLIVGICGAGKSTLARELAARLNLPLVHLDREFWQPGWILPDPAWWQIRVRNLAAGDRWIMDGSYVSTLHHRLPRADTIVHLDFPRSIATYRILKRIVFTYGKTRPDLAERCPEQFDWEFLQYAWAFPKKGAPEARVVVGLADRDQTLIRLTRPREVRRFLQGLSASTPHRQIPMRIRPNGPCDLQLLL